MPDAHPCGSIDPAAAVEAMCASLSSGGYWDAHAVALRPELADADLGTRWRLLDDLAEDDETIAEMLAEQPYDGPLAPALSAVVRSWTERRAAWALRTLSGIPVTDGRVDAVRALRSLPEGLRTPLGVFWCWDPSWCGGADAYWDAEGCSDLPLLHVSASVPVSSVDWQATMLCAMDYLCGDDERELRLKAGAPLRITGVEVGTDKVPTPDALREGAVA